MVYKEMKDRGFYLTKGSKYGTDFLVYKDDPNFVHSEYLLHIMKADEQLKVHDLILKERVSLNNKKKLLIATVDHENSVLFYNFEWTMI